MEGLVDSYKHIEIISLLCKEIKKKMKLKAGGVSLIYCHADFLPATNTQLRTLTCSISISGAGTGIQRILHSPVSAPTNPYFRVPQNYKRGIDRLVRREIRSSALDFLTFTKWILTIP
jgi:hypothetical protein